MNKSTINTMPSDGRKRVIINHWLKRQHLVKIKADATIILHFLEFILLFNINMQNAQGIYFFILYNFWNCQEKSNRFHNNVPTSWWELQYRELQRIWALMWDFQLVQYHHERPWFTVNRDNFNIFTFLIVIK